MSSSISDEAVGAFRVGHSEYMAAVMTATDGGKGIAFSTVAFESDRAGLTASAPLLAEPESARNARLHLLNSQQQNVIEGLRAELADKTLEAETYHGMSVRLNGQLAALRAAGGPSDADVMTWVAEHPHFGDWDEWAPIAYDKIPVLPRMALSHLYAKHADRDAPFAHCVFCELFDLRAAGGQEKPTLCPCGHPVHADPCGAPIGEHECVCRQRPLAAAPVGGQAEPSDATTYLAECQTCRTLREPDPEHPIPAGAASRAIHCGTCEGIRWHRRSTVRAAAVSGEQATPPSEDVLHDCPSCSHELVGDHNFHGCAVFGCACRVSGGAAGVGGLPVD